MKYVIIWMISLGVVLGVASQDEKATNKINEHPAITALFAPAIATAVAVWSIIEK